jgi:hypothetical protein
MTIQSIQPITVLNSSVIVVFDWAIHGHQNLSLKASKSSSSDIDNTPVSDAYVGNGLINV